MEKGCGSGSGSGRALEWEGPDEWGCLERDAIRCHMCAWLLTFCPAAALTLSAAPPWPCAPPPQHPAGAAGHLWQLPRRRGPGYWHTDLHGGLQHNLPVCGNLCGLRHGGWRGPAGAAMAGTCHEAAALARGCLVKGAVACPLLAPVHFLYTAEARSLFQRRRAPAACEP